MSNNFDAEYKRLRAAGAAGWGGSDCSRRRDGWIRDLNVLRQIGAIPVPPAIVLELGSGAGTLTAILAKAGYQVYGIETSQQAVDWAHEDLGISGLHASLQQGDVRNLPFDDSTFDFVFDGACLHCLIGSERLQCLKEVYRVLKVGGTFIVSTMCWPPRSQQARQAFHSETFTLFKEGQPYRTLKKCEDISSELEEVGLKITWNQIRRNPWWDHLTLACVKE